MSLALNGDHFCIIGRAPRTSTRFVKPVTHSQEALVSLLAKRRERYLAEKKKLSRQHLCTKSSTNNNDSASYLSLSRHSDNQSHERICDRRFIHHHLTGQPTRDHHHHHHHHHQPMNQSHASIISGIDTIGCTELAARVVSQAKVRLKKRQKRNANLLLQAAYKPVSVVVGKKTPHIRNSTPIKAKFLKRLVQEDCTSIENIRRGMENLCRTQKIGTEDSKSNYKTVVYLSERQSITPKDTGIPNVPPVTPDTLHYQDIRFVPAMSDIKSQRELKNRLQSVLALRLKGNNNDNERLENKQKKKEAVQRLKAKQRAEIYALNKIMTEFEKEKFEVFISGKV